MDELIWLFLVYWWKLQKGASYQQMHAQGESRFSLLPYICDKRAEFSFLYYHLY